MTKIRTDSSDGHKYPIEESGSRDDSDSPITFATPLMDDTSDYEKEEFAKSKGDDEQDRIDDANREALKSGRFQNGDKPKGEDARIDEQDDQNKLEAVKEEQERAEQEKIADEKDEEFRNMVLGYVNSILDGSDTNAEKYEELQWMLDEYGSKLTKDDRIQISDEIKYYREQAREDEKDEKFEDKARTEEQRVQARRQREIDRKQRVKDAKDEVRLGFQSLKSSSSSQRPNTGSRHSTSFEKTSDSNNTSKIPSNIDKDSALRLSPFLAKGI